MHCMSSLPFQNPDDETIRKLLQRIRSIAVVGLSPRPERPSHGVANALKSFGYQIIPVRPGVDEVLGERAWPDLNTLVQAGHKPDLVAVFRAPVHVPEIVETVIELEIEALWLQEGVVNEVAAVKAREADITVVMDRCMYKEYVRLMR